MKRWLAYAAYILIIIALIVAIIFAFRGDDTAKQEQTKPAQTKAQTEAARARVQAQIKAKAEETKKRNAERQAAAARQKAAQDAAAVAKTQPRQLANTGPGDIAFVAGLAAIGGYAIYLTKLRRAIA